jgi:hypothetical protein
MARRTAPAPGQTAPVPNDPAPCVPLAAERGTAAWTRRLEGGRPAGLTVKEAGRAHCCIACGHTIARGVLYGASVSGLLHYCTCCVTLDRPETQFIPGKKAA